LRARNNGRANLSELQPAAASRHQQVEVRPQRRHHAVEIGDVAGVRACITAPSMLPELTWLRDRMSATEVELKPFSQESSIAATMIRLRVSIA
jgi:hypothetical protein